MRAEIIAVGSELLTPDRLDTNSLFLTEKLNEAGFRVHLKTVVGDDKDDIVRVFEAALARSDLIIIIGGLGPTEDDLTRPAVAQVLGRKLRIDSDVIAVIRMRFAARGVIMPQINERQAQVIAGAQVLGNPFGTAPGMWIEEKAVKIALLPGPPRELQAIFLQSIQPRIEACAGGRRLARRSVHVVGMTESEVDSLAAPVYRQYRQVKTTILASNAQISLYLNQWISQGEEPAAAIELASRLQQVLGDAVYSTTGESLETVVGALLRETAHSLSVAESCTSGVLGMRVTRVPGSSDYFLGGVLCYSNDVKKALCGIPPDLLDRHGAVSKEAAEALAKGVRRACKSSLGLSITGIAGPGGGTVEKPVGLVYIAIAHELGAHSERRIIPGDRESVRERAATYALAYLRRFLLNESRSVSGAEPKAPTSKSTRRHE